MRCNVGRIIILVCARHEEVKVQVGIVHAFFVCFAKYQYNWTRNRGGN
jgi:hypothetical protein